MQIKVVKVNLSKTNALLERIALALERAYPVTASSEITEVVVDELVEFPQVEDESAGLDELRKQNQRSRKTRSPF